MDRMLQALTPAFVVSFAIQQFLELISPLFERFAPANKKWMLGILSLVLALATAFGLHIRLMAGLGMGNGGFWDGLVTALFLTGGTKGVNDLLKWIGYKKEGARKTLAPSDIARV